MWKEPSKVPRIPLPKYRGKGVELSGGRHSRPKVLLPGFLGSVLVPSFSWSRTWNLACMGVASMSPPFRGVAPAPGSAS